MSRQIEIPGKVFLIGEYSVIDGGRALVAALSPGYQYSKDEGAVIKPHPDSPLGKYYKTIEPDALKNFAVRLKSNGLALGLGSSTAEPIAASYFHHAVLPETAPFWEWYRKHSPGHSGADLATQLEALHQKHGLFEVFQVSKIKLRPHVDLFQHIYLFQVGVNEKLPTHQALQAQRARPDVNQANEMVQTLLDRINHNSISAFEVFTQWADFLNQLGLETPEANAKRKSFSAIKGVVGVKGCGAGLNDLFMVGVNEAEVDLAALMKTAGAHQLKFLGTLQERIWK